MLRIPLPEYVDGTLRKLTANSKLIPLSLGLFCHFVPSQTAFSSPLQSTLPVRQAQIRHPREKRLRSSIFSCVRGDRIRKTCVLALNQRRLLLWQSCGAAAQFIIHYS